MPRMVCPEFDAYEELLRDVQARYLLTTSGGREWRLHCVDSEGVVVMYGQDGTGSLFQAACLPGVYGLFIPLGTQAGQLTLDGHPMNAGDVAWLWPQREFHMRCHVPIRWLSVMIETGPAPGPVQTLAGEMLASPARCGGVPRDILGRLVAHARCMLQIDAHGSPPAIPAGLREGLLVACAEAVRSLTTAQASRHGRPLLERRRVIERTTQLIESRLDQPLALADLCREAGISGRTLHAIYGEHMGLSPHQYIVARRLHGIHCALKRARPEETVSEICGRFGVWDFGRFAGSYRARFNRAPSETLAAARRRASGAVH